MSDEKPANVGASVVVGLILMVPLAIVTGSTLAKLWEWFVADTFGVLAISTAQAIGLAMVVTFVTYQSDARNDVDDELNRTLSLFFGRLMTSGMSLLMGAVVKGFI